MRDIVFLHTADVLQAHAFTINREGGLPGVRDRSLLESAVGMASQQFAGTYLHDGLAAMAAAYLFHITANHPFVDGNKRAGALAALLFLDANGVENLPEPDDLERVTLAVADGTMGKAAATNWFAQAIQK